MKNLWTWFHLPAWSANHFAVFFWDSKEVTVYGGFNPRMALLSVVLVSLMMWRVDLVNAFMVVFGTVVVATGLLLFLLLPFALMYYILSVLRQWFGL